MDVYRHSNTHCTTHYITHCNIHCNSHCKGPMVEARVAVAAVDVRERARKRKWVVVYGVATISRLLKIIGLFCKRAQ